MGARCGAIYMLCLARCDHLVGEQGAACFACFAFALSAIDHGLLVLSFDVAEGLVGLWLWLFLGIFCATFSWLFCDPFLGKKNKKKKKKKKKKKNTRQKKVTKTISKLSRVPNLLGDRLIPGPLQRYFS